MPPPALARRAVDEGLFFEKLEKEEDLALCFFRPAPGVLRKDIDRSMEGDSSVLTLLLVLRLARRNSALLSGPGVLANRPRDGDLRCWPFRSRMSKHLEPGPPWPWPPSPPLPMQPIPTPLMYPMPSEMVTRFLEPGVALLAAAMRAGGEEDATVQIGGSAMPPKMSVDPPVVTITFIVVVGLGLLFLAEGGTTGETFSSLLLPSALVLVVLPPPPPKKSSPPPLPPPPPPPMLLYSLAF
mmetsp:Transcript_29659/g.86407  ORF Transcript_29659/g.86407 Transcript_29659/m.86407 type:complete len:240 (-) Transcript_29659:802-1521(-)